jgi:PAS domain S-box-containing protein
MMSNGARPLAAGDTDRRGIFKKTYGRPARHRTLALTVAAFCGVLTIGFAAFCVILGFSLIQRAKSDTRSMASALEQYAIRTLEVGDLVAEDVLEHLRTRGHLEGLPTDAEAFSFLEAREAKLPPGSAIIFVDAAGLVVLRSDEHPARPVDLSDRDWFRAHLEGAERVIGAALYSRITNRIIFVYTIALRRDDGSFLGAINLGIPSDELIGPHALPYYGEDVTLTLLRSDGSLVARNNFPMEYIGERFDLPASAFEQELSLFANRPIDQRYSVISSLPMPAHGLAAMAGIPMAVVLRPLIYTMAGGLPILALILGGAVYAYRSLRQQQAALDAGAERLAVVLEAAHLGTWHWNVQSGRVQFNERCADMLGYRLDDIEPHVRSWETLIHPEERERVMAILKAHLDRQTAVYQCEHRLRHKDGHWVWILDSGRVVERDRDGKPVIMTGTHLDISERVANEERLNFLMREVDHRSKNLLAVVRAVADLTRADTVADFKKGLRGRIAALALAHTLLAENRWRAVGLEELVQGETAPYQTERARRVEYGGPPIKLSPSASQAIAMALHELATNAAKYGALSTPTGRVRVGWTLSQAEGVLELNWREEGGPPTAAPQQTGFGSTVINKLVQQQLRGSTKFHWHHEGLECVIRIPIDNLADTAPLPGSQPESAPSSGGHVRN